MNRNHQTKPIACKLMTDKLSACQALPGNLRQPGSEAAAGREGPPIFSFATKGGGVERGRQRSRTTQAFRLYPWDPFANLLGKPYALIPEPDSNLL